MKDYIVEVQEVLSRLYIVQAEDSIDARQQVTSVYERGDIMLNAEDYLPDSGIVNTIGVAHEGDDKYITRFVEY